MKVSILHAQINTFRRISIKSKMSTPEWKAPATVEKLFGSAAGHAFAATNSATSGTESF